MVSLNNGSRTIKTEPWFVVCVAMMAIVVVAGLNGPNVCMVKQKYNITKRVKYRAPMSVRTYEWCLSIPPRCSKWNTEMRDLTRLETEERTAEVAVCCRGYKMKDVSCVPICPNGKTGPGCSKDCPPKKWGPNCIHDCKECSERGLCSPITGDCQCQDGWQGESCEIKIPTTTVESSTVEDLLTTNTTTKTTTMPVITPSIATTIRATLEKSSNFVTRPTVIKIIPTTVTSAATTQNVVRDIQDSAGTVMNILESVPDKPRLTVEKSSTTTEKQTTKFMTTIYDNSTVFTEAVNIHKPTEVVNKKYTTTTTYNRSDTPLETTQSSTRATFKTSIETTTLPKAITPLIVVTTEAPLTTPMVKEIVKLDTKKSDITTRISTTTKFKPKEIWIRPAQKGESVVETKIKSTHEILYNDNHSRHKGVTNKESTQPTTTPKTIIVSIIPTSVSYATFKKMALTTISLISLTTDTTIKMYNKTKDQAFTKPISAQTTTSTVSTTTTTPILKKKSLETVNLFYTNATMSAPSSTQNTTSRTTLKITQSSPNGSNSMTTYAVNSTKNSSLFLTTTVSSTNAKSTQGHNVSLGATKTTRPFKEFVTQISTVRVTNHSTAKFISVRHRNVTAEPVTNTTKVTKELNRKKLDRTNATKTLTKVTPITNIVTTDDPSEDEETFHILTEPEHITAVMGEKGTERSSVDLISVISIAGGVMMAVITVAVIIVMVERCKRPRYEDVRKVNDIHMQVTIDNNDVPPPYVRSIFHTPLPDPPNAEKCHYQPISTLDRNLKQFMRPVVVQTISPIMLENFRGILECHYDHLPRRSHDFSTIQTRSSKAPSMDRCNELRHLRASVTESTIEALKCEAKLDVIDNTTLEPLYAEIPCWRPPSEHAIEIMNLNGEAVTEL